MNHGHIVAMGTVSDIETKYGSGQKLSVKGSMQLLNYLKENTHLQTEWDVNGTVSIHLRDKDDALVALGAIEESGTDWRDLVVRRDSLEDIFLRLVGPEGKEAGEGK